MKYVPASSPLKVLDPRLQSIHAVQAAFWAMHQNTLTNIVCFGSIVPNDKDWFALASNAIALFAGYSASRLENDVEYLAPVLFTVSAVVPSCTSHGLFWSRTVSTTLPFVIYPRARNVSVPSFSVFPPSFTIFKSTYVQSVYEFVADAGTRMPFP